MVKKGILILLILIISNQCVPQDSVDSLKRIINSNVHDTTRAVALYDILNFLPLGECEHYNDLLISFSEKILTGQKVKSPINKRFRPFLAEGYYNKGVFLSNRNCNDSALLFYAKGLREYRILKDSQMIAYNLMNMAIIHTSKGDFTKATDLLYSSLRIHEKDNNMEGIGDTYMHIARVYHIQEEYEEAIKFTKTALTAYKKADYKNGMIEALYKLGFIELDLLHFTKAKNNFLKCIDLAKKIGIKDKTKIDQMLYACNGYLFYHDNKPDSAIYYFKKSIDLAGSTKETYTLGTRYLDLARAYFKKKQHTEASFYGNKSLEIAVETKNIDLQFDVSFFLSLVYKDSRNFEKAFEMQEIHLILYDSIQKEEQKKAVLKQQLKYEFEKKELLEKARHEDEIKTIISDKEKSNMKKNSRFIILVIVVLGIAIIAFFMFRNQKQKNIIEIQNSNILRQKLLLAQMNPHFIFNSINSIQSCILQKRELDAYSYLAKFAKLIRMVLNNSEKDYIPIYEEVELITLYIEIEQLRFDNSFDFEIIVNEEVDDQNINLPPMIVQPYVENAIWHGIMNLDNKRKGKLALTFSRKDKLLKIEVRDNGVGRIASEAYKNDREHRPMAMKLTRKRLELLNDLYRNNGIDVVVHDLYDSDNIGCGTIAEIYLPINFHGKDYE
ncbi:MAG: hypothetical protein A2W91_06615 [Bacteroidetes bacterium GWF2_38_335]|nr:MAG: hypothetical protein A2W91_06615 [Bacteroidetes bacterium GWF2_38_335]OFY77703.1 MAG: hypothetical protein A2281_18130 [Bacteroidetes bacterium RIFOXYA12_FULL_38_20]